MTTPWTNQRVDLVILQEDVSGFSGMFGYSPSIGPGNLIFSIAAVAGVDPYGNPYPAGLSLPAGTITGGTLTGVTIQSSSISSSTLTANTINGGTLTASNVIISNTAGGLFVYSTGGTIVQTFTSSTTWVAPAGVSSVQVQCWGGGAGGGGAATRGSGNPSVLFWAGNAGGAGGGGEYAAEPSNTCTPGNTYTITIGAGGAAGTSASGSTGTGTTSGTDGSNGGNTSFSGTGATTVTAHGGSGSGTGGTVTMTGSPVTNYTVGGGGFGSPGSGSSNSVVNSGGFGSSSLWCFFQTGNSGNQNLANGAGGGSSGSSSTFGSNGTGFMQSNSLPFAGGVGGTVAGGGAGGNGAGFNSGGSTVASTTGSVPGGGGGGGAAAAHTNTTSAPAAGAGGQVQITYTSSSTTLLAAFCGSATHDPLTSTSCPQGLTFFGSSSGSTTILTDSSGNLQVQSPAGTTLATFGSSAAVRFPSNVSTQVAIDTVGNLYLQNGGSWATLFSSTAGVPEYTKGNGLGITGFIPNMQVDTGTNSSTSSAVTALTKAWSIPAGDAEAGTIYRLRTKVSGNWPAQTGKPFIIVNGANTGIFPNTGTFASGFYTSGDGYVADIELVLVIVTNGSGGTARVGGYSSWLDVTLHSTPFVVPWDSGGATLDATISFNSTSATTMAFGWQWGATASHAITSNFSYFYREGP